MTIETKKLENINGAEMLYLVISNNKGIKRAINVGKKTYDEISKMIEDEGKNDAKERENIVDKQNKTGKP